MMDFWQYRDKLIELMKQYTPPTLEKYNYVKDNENGDLIWKGFRSIYLNRTSFNGMIKCGPIGGREQTGKWGVDACWKKPDNLIQRVKNNHEKLKNVKITCLDFEKVIREPGENVLMFLDPPYPERNNLYNIGMSIDDHKRLRNLLLETPHDFLLTYNECPEIKELYKNTDKFVISEQSWTYSMMSQSKEGCRVGKELFIMNHNLYNKYLNKKELEKTEQQKIKKIILVRTINNEDGIPEGESVYVEKEYKNFYKGFEYKNHYKEIVHTPGEPERIKIKKKNCKIVEYEQYGKVINLERENDNDNDMTKLGQYQIEHRDEFYELCKDYETETKINCEKCDYLEKYVNKDFWPDKCEKCGVIYKKEENNDLKFTDCEECYYQINYMGENKWSNICGKCGIDMSKYKGLMEIELKENNILINNNKNNKIMKTNDIELEGYEISEDMTQEEIEQEKYIKKINQEIDDTLLEEETDEFEGEF